MPKWSQIPLGVKILFFIGAALGFLFILGRYEANKKPDVQEVSYPRFLAAVEERPQDISELVIDERLSLWAEYTLSGALSKTAVPTGDYEDLLDTLYEHRDMVSYEVKQNAPPSGFSMWVRTLLPFLIPLLLIGFLLWIFMRSQQGAGGVRPGGGRSFLGGQNRSIIEKPNVTFNDVAGVDEAKEELQEVVDFLANPKALLALGARIPRGVLLVGPPGCGKTLLARAVAGESGNIPFLKISGSEFVELFVGVGAGRVRDLFDQAKKGAPSIIFIDEIDAVGQSRSTGIGGTNDERQQTLQQILVEMDGFESDTRVVVIAATNRPDMLDSALLRPGRFDRQIVVDHPDLKGRRAILEVHTKGKPFTHDVNLDDIAKQTPGFSGADLANLMNEAAILAFRRQKERISMAELNESIDRVIAGPERKSRRLSKHEKGVVAYHEAGHAIVSYLLPNADPPYKISIVARGMAGGFTRFMPEEERQLKSSQELKSRLAGMLGGYAAEKLVFGDVTQGASDDLRQATRLARLMVTRWGMSERIGPVSLGESQGGRFLGEGAESQNYSEAIAEHVDEEVRTLLENAEETATRLLRDNEAKLKLFVAALIHVETVEGEDLQRLFNEKIGPRPKA